tara:strand:- start:2290 stop:3306 length:1017 start_codon:yes stop_codon:yes gene_type:complete
MLKLDRTSKDLAIAALVLAGALAAAAYSESSSVTNTTTSPTPSKPRKSFENKRLAVNVTSKALVGSLRLDLPKQDQPQKPDRKKRLRKFDRFTALPVEIRELIYEHAMCQVGTFALPVVPAPSAKTERHRVLTECLPALCYTSRVERAIGISVFVRNAPFQLYREGDAAIMACWLEMMSDGYDFRSVRHVEIYYAPQTRLTGLTADVELLKRCPGLGEVTITIPLEDLFITRQSRSRPSVQSMRARTYSEILAKFQFGGLLDCGSLRKITFVVSRNSAFGPWAYVSPRPGCDCLQRLLAIMVAGFEMRHGRQVEMVMAWLDERGRIFHRLPIERFDTT